MIVRFFCWVKYICPSLLCMFSINLIPRTPKKIDKKQLIKLASLLSASHTLTCIIAIFMVSTVKQMMAFRNMRTLKPILPIVEVKAITTDNSIRLKRYTLKNEKKNNNSIIYLFDFPKVKKFYS